MGLFPGQLTGCLLVALVALVALLGAEWRGAAPAIGAGGLGGPREGVAYRVAAIGQEEGRAGRHAEMEHVSAGLLVCLYLRSRQPPHHSSPPTRVGRGGAGWSVPRTGSLRGTGPAPPRHQVPLAVGTSASCSVNTREQVSYARNLNVVYEDWREGGGRWKVGLSRPPGSAV